MNVGKVLSIRHLRAKFHGNGLKAQLFRGGAGSAVVKVGHTFLAFIVATLLARSLGAGAYGTYSFAYALVSLMAIPAQLGIPQLVMRETAKAHACGQWELLRGLWRWSTLAVWITSGVITLVALLGLYLWEGDLNELTRQTLLASFALIPLVALGNLRGAALRGLRRVVLGQLPELVFRPLLFVILILVAWAVGDILTSVTAMILHASAALIAFIAGAWILKKVKPGEIARASSACYHSLAWLYAAVPLGMVVGLQMLNSQTDVVMLGFLSTSEDVGVYKVAASVSVLVSFGLQVVNMAVSPHVARLHAQGAMDRLQNVVSKSSRFSVLLAAPVFLFFAVFGEWFLGFVFGAEYSHGYHALLVLVVGQLVNALFGSVGVLLNMTGHQVDSMRAMVMATLINIIMNALLIPLYGTVGAGLATALTICFWNVYMWRVARAKLGIQTFAF
ncbi:flippase [Halomonas nitroreducens]|uniref:flippase n=1 Tax=Halomonas nitroreducens TaxID=447425 RepID=UPI00163ADD46|nr:flippase [Halomonas nitroreducens]